MISQVRPSNQIFTMGSFNADGLTSNHFPHAMAIPDTGLPGRYAFWCKENCSHRWGWWFSDGQPFLGFEDEQEMVWFKMINLGVDLDDGCKMG